MDTPGSIYIKGSKQLLKPSRLTSYNNILYVFILRSHQHGQYETKPLSTTDPALSPCDTVMSAEERHNSVLRV